MNHIPLYLLMNQSLKHSEVHRVNMISCHDKTYKELAELRCGEMLTENQKEELEVEREARRESEEIEMQKKTHSLSGGYERERYKKTGRYKLEGMGIVWETKIEYREEVTHSLGSTNLEFRVSIM